MNEKKRVHFLQIMLNTELGKGSVGTLIAPLLLVLTWIDMVAVITDTIVPA